jgi:hypothetical protein
VAPGSRDPAHVGLAAQLSLGADLGGQAGDLVRERAQLVDHGVDGVLQLQDLALGVDHDLAGQVALGHRGRHHGDVAHLVGEIAPHQVDVLGQLLPDAGDVLDVRLNAQGSLGADLARDPGHLRGERAELLHHGVDGVLELEDLAAGRDVDVLGQVALGDRGRHLRDLAHLVGQVAGHQVHAVGQLLPDPGHSADAGLGPQLAVDPDLLGDAGDLGGEGRQLGDHAVDQARVAQEVPSQGRGGSLEVDGLAEVAPGHRAQDGRDVRGVGGDVVQQLVHPADAVRPASPGGASPETPVGAALDPDALAESDHVLAKGLRKLRQIVEGLADLPVDSRQVVGQAEAELAPLHRAQSGQELAVIQGGRALLGAFPGPAGLARVGGGLGH